MISNAKAILVKEQTLFYLTYRCGRSYFSRYFLKVNSAIGVRTRLLDHHIDNNATGTPAIKKQEIARSAADVEYTACFSAEG